MKVLAKEFEIKKSKLKIDFDYNKWGGFDRFDGEVFTDVLHKNFDFYIYCERKGDTFYTTFIPNFINPQDMTDWECEDSIALFSQETTYKTSFEDIVTNLKNVNGFDVALTDGLLYISNFDFYYAGLYGDKVHLRTELGKHPKFKELKKILLEQEKIS